jgi:hypothetical protein
MIKWNLNNKKKIFDVLKNKAKDLSLEEWSNKMNKIGVKKLVRRPYGKFRKLYTEEGKTAERDKDHVQISNPWWNDYQSSASSHLISIPKELAEKIVIFKQIPDEYSK